MTRAVMQLTDTDFAASATVVDVARGLVAAIVMDRLLETRIPRAAALPVVAVWAALPVSPSLQLAYSEALALALLSLTLLWLQREQWARAAVAAALLGLTRPMLPPLAVVFAVAIWLRWRRRATDPVLAAERRQMLAGLVATAAGSAVWPVVAWWATGVPNAYSRTEAAWHHGVLAPFAGLADLHQVVWHGQVLWLRVAVIAALVVAVSLTVVAVRSPRIDPLLATWCVAYLAFDLAVETCTPTRSGCCCRCSRSSRWPAGRLGTAGPALAGAGLARADPRHRGAVRLADALRPLPPGSAASAVSAVPSPGDDLRDLPVVARLTADPRSSTPHPRPPHGRPLLFLDRCRDHPAAPGHDTQEPPWTAASP